MADPIVFGPPVDYYRPCGKVHPGQRPYSSSYKYGCGLMADHEQLGFEECGEWTPLPNEYDPNRAEYNQVLAPEFPS